LLLLLKYPVGDSEVAEDSLLVCSDPQFRVSEQNKVVVVGHPSEQSLVAFILAGHGGNGSGVEFEGLVGGKGDEEAGFGHGFGFGVDSGVVAGDGDSFDGLDDQKYVGSAIDVFMEAVEVEAVVLEDHFSLEEIEAFDSFHFLDQF
jgi:hypothetical protein